MKSVPLAVLVIMLGQAAAALQYESLACYVEADAMRVIADAEAAVAETSPQTASAADELETAFRAQANRFGKGGVCYEWRRDVASVQLSPEDAARDGFTVIELYDDEKEENVFFVIPN